MDRYLDPTEVDPRNFEGVLLGCFGGLQLLALAVMGAVRSFPTWSLTVPLTIGSLLTMVAWTKTLQTTTRGQRIVAVLGLTILLVVSTLVMMVVTGPCTHCIYHWAEQAMALDVGSKTTSSGKTSSSGGVLGQLGLAWDLLLTKDEPQGPMAGACRKCVSSIFVVFLDDYWQWMPTAVLGGTKGKTLDATTTSTDNTDDDGETAFKFEPYQYAESNYDDLAPWYVHYVNKTASSNLQAFNHKFAKALSVDGHFTDEEITYVMEEFLCSPASRVDNPDPTKFLKDIKTPRFTGEATVGLNISTPALQRILRGDRLKELGAALCFILRFALFVPEDH